MNHRKAIPTEHRDTKLNILCDEYKMILQGCEFTEDSDNDSDVLECVVEKLISHCEWTPEAAYELVEIARSKGSFFLRNAAALAIAMGVEDGSDGY